MSHCFLLKIFFLSLLLGSTAPVFAIEVPKDAPPKHSFSEAEWKKITKGINYSSESPPPEPKPSREINGFDFNLPPGIAKAIIFILVFALLIFILVKILKGNILLSDKKLKTENAFTDASPDEDIHRDDLEALYAQAMAAGNFRLAVRYFYLLIIRELSSKQFITWKKEKTNSDYIFDLMNSVFNKPFREVTFLFEKIWYGETELSEQNFLLVNTRFNEFITDVKNNSSADREAPKPTTEPGT